jgi:hypothetical protein
MRRISAALVLLSVAAAGSTAQAQEAPLVGPPAIEAVASIANSSDEPGDPFVFLDLAATVPLGTRFAAIVRPYAHRLSGREWEAMMYQLEVRYQSQTRVPVRVDAGIITSPLGLGTLELRADLSPAIKTPFYYYMPLPPFEPRYDGVQLMSGGYPLGVIASASGTKWDARAGITDATPARDRDVFAGEGPDRMRQFVAGGGLSPVPGLRVGAGFAHGAYRSAVRAQDAASAVETPGANATVFNLEGEYAFGHTRISGEWIRNKFESPLGPAIARGYFVQGVQAFGPRLFGTVRIAGASSPAYAGGARRRRTMTATEVSAGYRLGQGVTVRGGYYASRRYGVEAYSHTAVASLVWARRWF